MDFGPFLLLASLEGLVMAAVLALSAVGLSLVFGVMRVVNVAHGEFYMLGAVISWFVTSSLGSQLGVHPAFGFLAALVIAPVLTGSVAAATNALILERIDHNPERTIVATIGILYILQQSALIVYGPDARPVEPPFNDRIALPWPMLTENGWMFDWPWGFGTTTYKLAVIGFAALVLTGVWLFLSRTQIGVVMRATQNDREMATAFGIAVKRVYALVFGLGAGLAALAAVLIVPIQQAHYLMGGEVLLLSFIVVILGGLGSLPGTVIAALFIGLSDGIISTLFSPTLAKIVATLLVASALIFRPQGLFGTHVE